MASTFPTTLDTFTNPLSTDVLTSPSHAQQHSDLNDAVEALEAKVAIGNTVLGTYTAYTPTFTSITVGNGTLAAQFCRVNNFVHAFGSLIFGSTSVMSSNPIMTLPTTTSITEVRTGIVLGTVVYSTAAGTATFGYLDGRASVNNGEFQVFNASTTYLTRSNPSATVPFTWAVDCFIRWNIYYKAA
jgi:hypothetical protein